MSLNENDLNLSTEQLSEFVIVEMSCENPNFDLIKKYIRQPNFNPNISSYRYNFFVTPLRIACQKDWTELVDLMIDDRSKIKLYRPHSGYCDSSIEMPAPTAVYNDSIGVLKLLVEKMNLDVNHKLDVYENTLLKMAIGHRSRKCLEYLLSLSQTNVNIQNPWGTTALMACAELGYADMMALLLAHKDIDTQIIKQDGKTAFHLACQKFNVECIRLLRDYETERKNFKSIITSCMYACNYRDKIKSKLIERALISDEAIIETFKIIFEFPIAKTDLDIFWYDKKMIDTMWDDDPLCRLVRNFLMYHGMKSDKFAPLTEYEIAEVKKMFYSNTI